MSGARWTATLQFWKNVNDEAWSTIGLDDAGADAAGNADEEEDPRRAIAALARGH